MSAGNQKFSKLEMMTSGTDEIIYMNLPQIFDETSEHSMISSEHIDTEAAKLDNFYFKLDDLGGTCFNGSLNKFSLFFYNIKTLFKI